MNQEIVNNLYNLLPELTLSIAILILTLTSAYLKNSPSVIFYIHLSGLIAALLFILLRAYSPPMVIFSGLLVLDPFAYFGKLIIALTAIFLTLASYYKAENPFAYVLSLALTLSAFGAVSSSNIVVTFVSMLFCGLIILIIISNHILSARSYFIYFSVSMAVLLYGFSLLYGITSSADYHTVNKFLSGNTANVLTLTISVIMIIAGLSFHLQLFPFNFNMPDIAAKISFRNLGLMSMLPAITALIVLSRFTLTVFHDTNSFVADNSSLISLKYVKWDLLLSIIAALSILAGNLGVLWQTNLKKIFSFIAIGQLGLIVTVLPASSAPALESAVIMIIAFIVNSAGLLLCMKIISEKFNAHSIDEIKSLGFNNKLIAVMLVFFLFSSAGFPLTIGFTGRLYLYSALAESDQIWVIAVSILSSIGFLYFAFRLISLLFSSVNPLKSVKIETNLYIILLILLIPAILPWVFLSPVLNWVKFCSNILL